MKSKSRQNRHARVLQIAALCLCLLGGLMAHAERTPYDWALIRLDYERAGKVAQLRRFCEQTHSLAAAARDDSKVIDFFEVNLKYSSLTARGDLPEELVRKVEKLREEFDDFYIRRFLAFYDLLFVNSEGVVFYSMRKEGDFGMSLVGEAVQHAALSQCIRSQPDDEVFLDFHQYGPSSEAAAFFVEPIHKGDERLGWLVLQCAINKVNSLFAWNEELGRTGETFLVNSNGYMLTESNFRGDSTILTKRLDDRNIKAKFKDGQGHRMVTDYRGAIALTSFEVFEFLGVRWLVVAKMDKAEVTTEHFAQHRKYYAERLLERLSQRETPPSRQPRQEHSHKLLRTDMDEFVRAKHGESLQTFGVSTCTAFVATYPGRFGYLAHISSRDRVYGGAGTNLVGQLVKKIATFDIYEYERQDVRFFIVASHVESLANIADKLIDEGFLLTQINVLYHRGAESARVTYDYSCDRLSVEWRSKEGSRPCFHNGEDAWNLAAIIEEEIVNGSQDDIAESIL